MADEFKPNWKLSPRDKLIVALCIVLPRHWPDWPGCTDEQMARMADDILAITEEEQASGNT